MTAQLNHIPANPFTIIQKLSSLGAQPCGVTEDSRQVQPGDLFVAYPGDISDGRCHISDAITRGASAVIWETGDDFTWDSNWNIANIPATGLRKLCGPLAHSIYGQPSERMSLIAITGTNGKTTISQWIARAHPRHCAIIGTLGAGFPERMTDTGFTTPEAATLTRLLSGFTAEQAKACALEASSIGIEEGRLDGSRIDVAIFTNLTRDHLDYHGSMESYAAAKKKLFMWPRLRLAVINLDDHFGLQLAESTSATKVIGYTQNDASDAPEIMPLAILRAENIEETMGGLRFRLCTPTGKAMVQTSLLGRYNVSNLLAVAAILIDSGLNPYEVAARLSKLIPPPGRLETFGGNNEPLIVVDYAHTPDALENALNALRGMANARGAALIVIFGCGGDRDRGKRSLMGEIATRLADRTVLTNDNPRSESPSSILDEIRVGAPMAEVVPDRAEAVRRTILAAHPADVILIAGKGHEPYQEISGVRTPFSDVVEARTALAARDERKQ